MGDLYFIKKIFQGFKDPDVNNFTTVYPEVSYFNCIFHRHVFVFLTKVASPAHHEPKIILTLARRAHKPVVSSALLA